MKFRLLAGVGIVVLFTLISGQLARAQDDAFTGPVESVNPDDWQLTPAQAKQLGEYFDQRATCFKGYHFNSVKFSFDSNSRSFDKGQAATITGSYYNSNDYPLVEGVLLARVLRVDNKVADDNWHPVIFERRLQENISLIARERKTFSFTWPVPKLAPAGTYRLELFFLTGNGRYPISGIPYIANFPGGAIFFDVKPGGAEKPRYVNFDRGQVAVNGAALRLREVPPVLPPQQDILVKIPLQALGSQSIPVTLRSAVYAWSQNDGEPPIKERTSHLDIVPDKPLTAQIGLTAPIGGAYEIVMTAVPDDIDIPPSTISLRLPVEGNTPRVIYSGIGGFKDGQAIITTCVVNGTYGSYNSVEKGVANISVGSDDNQLAKSALETRSDRLTAQEITVPIRNIGRVLAVSVNASNVAGQVTDSNEIKYDKSLFVAPSSTIKPGAQPDDSSGAGKPSRPWWLLIVFLVVMAVLWFFASVDKQKTPPDNFTNNQLPPL